MFVKHVWNNLLHASYEKLFVTIIEKRNEKLDQDLFEKADILRFIIQEFKEDQFELPK